MIRKYRPPSTATSEFDLQLKHRHLSFVVYVVLHSILGQIYLDVAANGFGA